MIVRAERTDGSRFCFGSDSLVDILTRCEAHAQPGDIWRVYVVNDANPYPGYVVAYVTRTETESPRVRLTELKGRE